jgi:hypothetical protein
MPQKQIIFASLERKNINFITFKYCNNYKNFEHIWCLLPKCDVIAIKVFFLTIIKVILEKQSEQMI